MNVQEISDLIDVGLILTFYFIIGFLLSFASKWEHLLLLGLIIWILDIFPEELMYVFLIGFTVDFLDEDIAFMFFMLLFTLFIALIIGKIILKHKFLKEES